MILIGNGPLITRNAKAPYYQCGGLIIDGNHIVDCGEWEQMKASYSELMRPLNKEKSVIDVKGKVIMPGLINAHHHIYSAFARGMGQTKGSKEKFLDILENMWWYLDSHLTVESTFHSGIATYMECIKNGVTVIVDHHASYGEINGSLSALQKASEMTGVRTCLCYEVSDRHGKEAAEQAIRENMDFANRVSKLSDGKVKALIGLHASFTLSDETIDLVKHHNTDGLGYHIHVSEGIEDERHCQENYGKSVVQRLCDQALLNPNSIAGHAIHVSEEDMMLLKSSGASVVHNPASNMANGVGAPDVVAMMKKGIPVGLGTDGYTSDMLASLKTANMLQKHHHQRGDVGFGEVIEMLFENNKKIATKMFGDDLGTIEKGALADVIAMDYKPITPMNAANYDGHIMFGMDGCMTDTVIIDGVIVYKDRKFTKLNEEDLLEASRASANKVWSVIYE